MGELTPLEEAVLTAMVLPSGLAVTAMIQEMVEKGGEVSATRKNLVWRENQEDREAFLATLRESREINQQLTLIASLNEVSLGISA